MINNKDEKFSRGFESF